MVQDLYVLMERLPLDRVRSRAAAMRAMGAAISHFDATTAEDEMDFLCTLHDHLLTQAEEVSEQRNEYYALRQDQEATELWVEESEILLLGIFECFLSILRLVSGPVPLNSVAHHRKLLSQLVNADVSVLSLRLVWTLQVLTDLRKGPLYTQLKGAPPRWMLVLMFAINSTGGRLLLHLGPLDVLGRECIRLWAQQDGGVPTLLQRCALYKDAPNPSEAALSMLMSAAKFARSEDVAAVLDMVGSLLHQNDHPSSMAYASATMAALLHLTDPSQLDPRVRHMVAHALGMLSASKPPRQPKAKAIEAAGREAVWEGAREGALVLLQVYAQRWEVWALEQPAGRMGIWTGSMDEWHGPLRAVVGSLQQGAGEGQEEQLDAMVRLAPVLEMSLVNKLLNDVLRAVHGLLQPLGEGAPQDLAARMQMSQKRIEQATRLINLASCLLERPTYSGSKAPVRLRDEMPTSPDSATALDIMFTTLCTKRVQAGSSDAFKGLVASGLFFAKAALVPLREWKSRHDEAWGLTTHALDAHQFGDCVDLVRAGLGVLEVLSGEMSGGSPLRRAPMLNQVHALVVAMQRDEASDNSQGLAVQLGHDVTLTWERVRGPMNNINNQAYDAIAAFCARYDTPRWNWAVLKKGSEGAGDADQPVSDYDPMPEDFSATDMDTSSS